MCLHCERWTTAAVQDPSWLKAPVRLRVLRAHSSHHQGFEGELVDGGGGGGRGKGGGVVPVAYTILWPFAVRRQDCDPVWMGAELSQ